MSRWRCLPPLLALVVVLASCGSPAGDTGQGRALAPPAATQPVTPFAVATAAAPVATPGGTLEVVAASPPPSCRVTRRPGPPFTPPPPYPPTPPALYGDRFWYGTDSLWTWLPADGVWRGWHRDGAYAYADKSIWWWHGYDGRTEQRPELTVSGRRLDAPAPIFENHGGATNGFRGDVGWFMLTGVDVPAPGCWEITGRYAGTKVRFVVWVSP